MNNYYGSSIWGPVGRGIEEIEAEMREIVRNELIADSKFDDGESSAVEI